MPYAVVAYLLSRCTSVRDGTLGGVHASTQGPARRGRRTGKRAPNPVCPEECSPSFLALWSSAAKPLARRRSLVALGLALSLSFSQPAVAADNFIQLYIAAQGGCRGNPLSFVLVGQDINRPFGKAAADWSDDDLATLEAVLNACVITSARGGNPYLLSEVKGDVAKLLANIPNIVGQARDQVRARNQQIEARRQMAAARIDKATQARQQAKASAEAQTAQLEREATAAEAEARDAQRRADARIERATRARDEAKAKAATIASLERSAQQDAGTLPRVRQAASGELSELVQEDEVTTAPSKPSGPLTATTVMEATACPTIDDVAASALPPASPSDKANTAPAASGSCVKVAKGTQAIVQAAGASPRLKALCVALEGHPGCLWMAKAAFGAADQQ